MCSPSRFSPYAVQGETSEDPIPPTIPSARSRPGNPARLDLPEPARCAMIVSRDGKPYETSDGSEQPRAGPTRATSRATSVNQWRVHGRRRPLAFRPCPFHLGLVGGVQTHGLAPTTGVDARARADHDLSSEARPFLGGPVPAFGVLFQR